MRTSTRRGRNETPCAARGSRPAGGDADDARAAEWNRTTQTPSLTRASPVRWGAASAPICQFWRLDRHTYPRSRLGLLLFVATSRRSPPRASRRSRTMMLASLPRAQLRFRLVRCAPVPSRTTPFFSRPPLRVARNPSRPRAATTAGNPHPSDVDRHRLSDAPPPIGAAPPPSAVRPDPPSRSPRRVTPPSPRPRRPPRALVRAPKLTAPPAPSP